MRLLAFQCNAQGIQTESQKEAHIDRLIAEIEEACTANPVDLIVLPELALIEYSEHAFQNLNKLAESLKGESFHQFAALARRLRTSICYGFPRKEDDSFFISQLVINSRGEYVTHYDKLHLAQFGASAEKPYFTRGNKLGIFEINQYKIGIIICYDMRFGEYVSHLVREYELDFILHPVAFTTDDSFPSWHPFVITRALENQIYWLSLNRAGEQWGCSIFCPPWIGDSVKPHIIGTEESMQFFEIDKSTIAQSRKSYPFHLDRLDFYSGLNV
ncbi:carbon-nitrogen hydrolase family protein [bacterium]|nr:carbon-nitrogen hydrolase family protein [bacterium]